MTQRPFVLWFRRGRRGRWERVAETPTYRAAVALIDNRGARSADWLIRDAARGDPNRDRPLWAVDRSVGSGE